MIKFLKLGVFVFLTMSFNADAYRFGNSGSSGRDGYSGQNGSSSKDVSLSVNGGFQYLDLAGTDGGDGQDGENGESAYSCYQPPRTSYNLSGADGGRGGNAGRGGSGGNGGDALLFIDKISDLSQVQLSNDGGLGGYGARGGSGGYGCDCRVRSWGIKKCWDVDVCKDVKTCYDKRERDSNGRVVTRKICRTNRVCHPQRKCRVDNFYCYDGDKGRSGGSTSKASDGYRGSVRVVKGLDSLPYENPSAFISLAKATGEDTLLSKRVWSVKSGAKSVFHPGSDISDNYYNFEKLAEAFYGVEWRSDRPISDFSKVNVSGEFGGSNIVIRPSNDIFYKGFTKIEGRTHLLVIEKAFREDEIADLQLLSAIGMGVNYQAVLEDKRSLNGEVETSIRVVLKYKKKLGGWVTVHNGALSSKYIEKGEKKIVLKLGQLSFHKEAHKIFKKKRRVSIEVFVDRKFGERTKSIRFSKVDYRL